MALDNKNKNMAYDRFHVRRSVWQNPDQEKTNLTSGLLLIVGQQKLDFRFN